MKQIYFLTRDELVSRNKIISSSFVRLNTSATSPRVTTKNFAGCIGSKEQIKDTQKMIKHLCVCQSTVNCGISSLHRKINNKLQKCINSSVRRITELMWYNRITNMVTMELAKSLLKQEESK